MGANELMLYERFWNWLTFKKRRECDHEFEKVGTSSTMINYDLYYYNHFKCSECGKKKKSLDSERSHSSGTYIRW